MKRKFYFALIIATKQLPVTMFDSQSQQIHEKKEVTNDIVVK